MKAYIPFYVDKYEGLDMMDDAQVFFSMEECTEYILDMGAVPFEDEPDLFSLEDDGGADIIILSFDIHGE